MLEKGREKLTGELMAVGIFPGAEKCVKVVSGYELLGTLENVLFPSMNKYQNQHSPASGVGLIC